MKWIKLNHRQIGYYMVNYSENDWSLLSNLLENNPDVSITIDNIFRYHFMKQHIT